MPDLFNWGFVSAMIIFISGLFYIVPVWRGTIQRPVVTTWGLWLLVGLILFFSNLNAGARWDTIMFPILMGVVNPLIIFILALRNGRYQWTRLDTVCTIACIVTMIVWLTSQSPLVGIVGGIIADICAAGPQFDKNWRDPDDEPIMPWVMFLVASCISLLGVQQWGSDVSMWLYPVYMTLGSAFGMVFPLVYHRWLKTR